MKIEYRTIMKGGAVRERIIITAENDEDGRRLAKMIGLDGNTSANEKANIFIDAQMKKQKARKQ